MDFIETLKAVDPSQYHYAPDEMHVTMLSLFTATKHHGQLQAALEQYKAAIEESLHGVPPFEIEFRGVTASPGAVVIQGFPCDAVLETIRGALRAALRGCGLSKGVDARYRLVTAHMTVVRFRETLCNSAELARTIEKNRETPFGLSYVSELGLVKSDWYMSEQSQELLARYPLPLAESNQNRCR
jgi:2'-5' RNA ligase